MVNINFPTDSKGTQALQKKNKTKSIAHVDAVTPDPENKNNAQEKKKNLDDKNPVDKHSEQNHSSPQKQTPNTEQQLPRSTDRRKTNRRQQNISVILNTRSDHDRRNKPDQREDNQSPGKSFGIDTKA